MSLNKRDLKDLRSKARAAIMFYGMSDVLLIRRLILYRWKRHLVTGAIMGTLGALLGCFVSATLANVVAAFAVGWYASELMHYYRVTRDWQLTQQLLDWKTVRAMAEMPVD